MSTKTRRSLVSVLALVCGLLMVALVIGACGSTTSSTTAAAASSTTAGGSSSTGTNGGSGASTTSSAATTTSGTTGSGSLASYTDSTFGYTFQYPKDWKLQKGDTSEVTAGGTSAGSVSVFDPNGAVAQDTYIDLAQVSVYRLNQAVDPSLMPQVKAEVESVLSSLESQAADMKTLEPLAQTTINGMPGFTVTYGFTKNGTPATTTLYFLFNGAVEYQVTAQAAEKNWNAKKPIFDALVASFKPGAD